MSEPEPDDGLTDRQLEVARLISDGCTDKEISQTLGISIRTVGAHVNHIMLRWQLNSQRNVRVQITRRILKDAA